MRGVVKRYGSVEVIHGVDLDIVHGEFVVFVGPSGCGKTTLLRMIAGLEEISDGELRIDGERMNEVPPAKRQIAMVFQSYALYPHMTVFANLAFGLQTAGERKDVIDARVRQVARMLKIDPYLERKPKALSGGQRQRVAIGRAIVREPKLFLFDEPLSNLDAELRVQMRVELSKLHAELGNTMIYVTHDQVEAMTMADRIVVLKDGVIEQVGTPLELYNRPANRFVAGFIGNPKMNFLEGTIVPDVNGGFEVTLAGGARLDLSGPRKSNGNAAGAGEDERNGDRIMSGAPVTVSLGVRPEHIVVEAESAAAVRMDVALTEQLGGNTVIYGALANGAPLVVQVAGQSPIERGDAIGVRLPPEACHLFDASGKALARA